MDMVDTERYARHISLPDVGITGQKLIDDSRVLVVGAGGLGSPVLMYLAAAGIGHIGVVDDDVVDLSNLQRQIIHSESAIGRPKVESAKERINSINSAIKVTTWNARLSPDNAEEILCEWDIVIDGTDNIPTRYLVDDVCNLLGIPWIYGSIYRFEGQVSLFNYHNGPCYRDLFPEPPPLNTIPSCAEGGVFGVLPGIIGSIQATEAVKIILGRGQSLSGKLFLYDADNMTSRTLKFSKNTDTEPDLSEVRKMFEDSGWCSSSSASNNKIPEPSANNDTMFNHLSVAQYQEKRLMVGNRFLSMSDLTKNTLNSKSHLLICKFLMRKFCHNNKIYQKIAILSLCRSGMRSQIAAMYLLNAGYSSGRLYNLDGGIMAWRNQLPQDIE